MTRQWRNARYPRTDKLVGRAHFDWAEQAILDPGDGELLIRPLCRVAPDPAHIPVLARDVAAG